jgi:16S rRNA (adenine1518-N6/adenine1519-N6)-dimethyltransferase
VRESLHHEVREALRERPFGFKKSLGQHFLVDGKILDSIIQLSELSGDDKVLEIGPGLGFLTRRLVARVSEVWAVEIDPFLVQWLGTHYGESGNLHVIHGDILKVDLGSILPVRKVVGVGNLPYNIATPILFRLFENRSRFSRLILMVQKEVADRMAATPGNKTYGTLSVWCQIHGKIAGRLAVPPSAFSPRPKVASSVLGIELYPEPRLPVEDLPGLRAWVRAAFGQRRKTLANACAGLLEGKEEVERLLREQGIDPQRRGETLTIDEFIRLTAASKARMIKDPDAGGRATDPAET